MARWKYANHWLGLARGVDSRPCSFPSEIHILHCPSSVNYKLKMSNTDFCMNSRRINHENMFSWAFLGFVALCSRDSSDLQQPFHSCLYKSPVFWWNGTLADLIGSIQCLLSHNGRSNHLLRGHACDLVTQLYGSCSYSMLAVHTHVDPCWLTDHCRGLHIHQILSNQISWWNLISLSRIHAGCITEYKDYVHGKCI